MTQLTIDFAREAGAHAAARCAEKAERTTGFSTDGARHWVLEHLERHGATSGEDLVDGLRENGFTPHDDRAFGVVFGGLSREKRIEKYGFAERRKGHGTYGAIVWRLARHR